MKKLLLLISIFVFGFSVVQAQTANTVSPAQSITSTSATITGTASAGAAGGPYDVYLGYGEYVPFQPTNYSYVKVASNISTTVTTYSRALSGLNPATDYEFQIATVNTADNSVTYGGGVQFTTLSEPTATSGVSSSITKTTASLAGAVTLGGSSQSHNLYFQYRIAGAAWSSINASPASTTSDNNSVTGSLTGLTAATTYEWRMYMENTNLSPVEVYEGNIQSFTTDAPPTVVTKATSAITVSTATFNGELTAPNGETYSVKFRYRVSGGFAWTEVASNQGNLTGNGAAQNFDANVTGLTQNTSYEVEAFFVDNTVSPAVAYYAGDATGNFTTNAASNPIVKTGTLNTLSFNTANIINNELTTDGGLLCDGGIVYGTSSSPTTANSTKVSYTGKNSTYQYNATLTGLTASTHYYARAYATNSNGTAYAATEVDFYTSPANSANFTSITGLTDNDHTILTLNWSPGDGSGRLIVAFQKGTSATNPVDGQTYLADANYGTGDVLGAGFVLYSGSGATSLSVTGLNGDNEDYDFYIYEYSGVTAKGTANINYKQDSPGFISTDGTTFPIELLSFTAKSESSNVILEWSTATETNNDYFEIERSTDAENFEVVKKLPGAGNSNEIRSYAVVDKANFTGTVYYRLKQTDFDGKTTTSFVIPVIIGASNDIQISNVINDNSKLSFIYNNSNGGKTMIELLDVNGRIVNSKELEGEGSNLVRFNMNGMSRGMYIIHISVGDEMITKKVVY